MTCVICRQGEARPGKATVTLERGGEPSSSSSRGLPAPRVGTKVLRIGGREEPLRPNLGLLAQTFSCIGLPVVTIPVFARGEPPLGVQIIAAPRREDLCLRAAAFPEEAEVAVAHPSHGARRLRACAS